MLFLSMPPPVGASPRTPCLSRPCVLVFCPCLCYWPARISERPECRLRMLCLAASAVAETPEKRAKMPINAPSRFIKSVSTALLIFVGFGCATAPDPSEYGILRGIQSDQ